MMLIPSTPLIIYESFECAGIYIGCLLVVAGGAGACTGPRRNAPSLFTYPEWHTPRPRPQSTRHTPCRCTAPTTKPLKQKNRTIKAAMRKTKEDYPSVHTWSYITIEEFPMNSSCRQVLANLSEIEGYCMLNMDYGGCYSRYDYELKPDGSRKRVKNKQYDPSKKPDPYPEGCPRSVRCTCIGCKHFAWCDPRDDENHDSELQETTRPYTLNLHEKRSLRK